MQRLIGIQNTQKSNKYKQGTFFCVIFVKKESKLVLVHKGLLPFRLGNQITCKENFKNTNFVRPRNPPLYSYLSNKWIGLNKRLLER